MVFPKIDSTILILLRSSNGPLERKDHFGFENDWRRWFFKGISSKFVESRRPLY